MLVTLPIDLDRQTGFVGVEVEDVMAHRVLTPKAGAAELATAKRLP